MKKIIIDTDIGFDCDDAGALAIAFDAAAKKKIELLAVTCSIDNLNSCKMIEKLLRQYGIDVPVGRCGKKGFMTDEIGNKFTLPLAGDLEKNDYPDGINLMKGLLYRNNNVTIVTIGSFVNIAELLRREPRLLESSGAELVSMAGDFETDTRCEFNVRCSIESARYTAANCGVPITYCGFEAGAAVVTGALLEGCDEEFLVRQAYRIHQNGGYLRPSWDLLTVYYAVYGLGEILSLSDGYTVSFDGKGRTVKKRGGRDRYIICRDGKKAAAVLDRLMCGPFLK